MKFLHQWFCLPNKWLYNIGELFRGWNKDEANASKNSYVWSKNTKRYKGNVTENKQLLAQLMNLMIMKIIITEIATWKNLVKEFRISSEKIKETAQKINATIVAKKAELKFG